MKSKSKAVATKLVAQFDQQLHEILMSDLQAIRNARVNLIKHITVNNRQERFMTA